MLVHLPKQNKNKKDAHCRIPQNTTSSIIWSVIFFISGLGTDSALEIKLFSSLASILESARLSSRLKNLLNILVTEPTLEMESAKSSLTDRFFFLSSIIDEKNFYKHMCLMVDGTFDFLGKRGKEIC